MADNEKLVVSAGFLIKSADDKYLIVKPFGGSTKGWGIPKGKRDKNESIFDAAVRETYEETALHIDGNKSVEHYESEPFFHYTVDTTEGGTKKKFLKHVYVFRAYATKDIETYPFKCLTFLEDGRPEIEKYEWVSLEEAYEKVVKSQKGIFEFLINYKKTNEAGYKS
jgi:8-oxo-dGTP pyrophosphatase MutT (NUDIX family)